MAAGLRNVQGAAIPAAQLRQGGQRRGRQLRLYDHAGIAAAQALPQDVPGQRVRLRYSGVFRPCQQQEPTLHVGGQRQ